MKYTRILLTGWMCICASGLLCAKENCRRTHLDMPVTICDTTLSRQVSAAADRPVSSLTIETRGALAKVKERIGMSKTRWGIAMTAPGDTLNVTLHFGNTDFGDMLDRRIALITVTRNNIQLYSHEAKGFRMSSGDLNTLTLTLSDSTLCISGGGERDHQLAEVDIKSRFEPTDAHVWSEGKLLLTVFSTETCSPFSHALGTTYTHEQLRKRFQSTHDPIESYWTYFDRSNDPMYAKLGGRYTLAVIKREDAATSSYQSHAYDIVYISGAKTLGENWQPMMLKGTLRTTIFQGHYDLEWIDSTFDRISDDIHATLDSDNSLLTLSFPLLKTTIRFSKMPVEK